MSEKGGGERGEGDVGGWVKVGGWMGFGVGGLTIMNDADVRRREATFLNEFMIYGMSRQIFSCLYIESQLATTVNT